MGAQARQKAERFCGDGSQIRSLTREFVEDLSIDMFVARSEGWGLGLPSASGRAPMVCDLARARPLDAYMKWRPQITVDNNQLRWNAYYLAERVVCRAGEGSSVRLFSRGGRKGCVSTFPNPSPPLYFSRLHARSDGLTCKSAVDGAPTPVSEMVGDLRKKHTFAAGACEYV